MERDGDSGIATGIAQPVNKSFSSPLGSPQRLLDSFTKETEDEYGASLSEMDPPGVNAFRCLGQGEPTTWTAMESLGGRGQRS